MSSYGHDTRSPLDKAYLCPEPFDYDKSRQIWNACKSNSLLGWCASMLQDGRSFLRLQPAYKYISDGLDLVNGDSVVTDVQSLSNVRTESTVRNVKEIIAAQTNLRIIPAFKAAAPELEQQNTILNKGFMAWQNMTFADRMLRKAWQWACVGGTGYIGTRYNPNYYYRGCGDLVWDAYGPLDVIPLGLPPDLRLQGAYAVALRKPMPIHQVWRMFPLMRDQIKPNRVSTQGKGMVVAQAVKFASAVLQRFSQGVKQPEQAVTWDNTDVYYIYIDDDSINETGAPIEMKGPDGQWGTSWSYTVPFVTQEIPTGRLLSGGRPETKKAERLDCQLYPNKRLLVATDTCVLNPDPTHQSSYRWDAQIPITQFRCDDWAWNFLGFPATRYGQSLEKLAIELWRGIGDKMNQSLNPSAFYDRNSTAQALLQTVNPRIPGLRVGLDMTLNPASSSWLPMLPREWHEVSPIVVETAAKILPAILKDQMGVADAAALARARQIPAGDSTEKLLEALGPIIKDQSRNMEESIRHLGEMWKSDWFQFATAKRRMQLLGPEGISEEDFDYDPGTLVPLTRDPRDGNKFVEMAEGPNGTWNYSPGADNSLTGRMPSLAAGHLFERARWHKANFTFSVTPYSLHEFNSQTRKLFMLQLMKFGFPLSWWTLADTFDVKNFGPCMVPDENAPGGKREARNEIERWIAQLEIMSRVAQAGGGKGKGHGATGNPRGRPDTFQASPAMETKRGGVDSIVRTSGR